MGCTLSGPVVGPIGFVALAIVAVLSPWEMITNPVPASTTIPMNAINLRIASRSADPTYRATRMVRGIGGLTDHDMRRVAAIEDHLWEGWLDDCHISMPEAGDTPSLTNQSSEILGCRCVARMVSMALRYSSANRSRV